MLTLIVKPRRIVRLGVVVGVMLVILLALKVSEGHATGSNVKTWSLCRKHPSGKFDTRSWVCERITGPSTVAEGQVVTYTYQFRANRNIRNLTLCLGGRFIGAKGLLGCRWKRTYGFFRKGRKVVKTLTGELRIGLRETAGGTAWVTLSAYTPKYRPQLSPWLLEGQIENSVCSAEVSC